MSFYSRWQPLIDEDRHTALVFGFLRHAPPEAALNPWLSATFGRKVSATSIQPSSFWPNLPSKVPGSMSTEPEIVFDADDGTALTVIVEVKPGYDMHTLEQIQREVVDVAAYKGAERIACVMIGADLGPPLSTDGWQDQVNSFAATILPSPPAIELRYSSFARLGDAIHKSRENFPEWDRYAEDVLAQLRRKALLGYQGLSAGGRKYEFCYQGSDGRTRWHTVVGGLREARRARADVLCRLGRGERVAPTKRTLAEVADEWLAAQTQLRPRTRAVYETNLRVHVLPRLGRRKIANVDEDDIARLIVDLHEKGLAGWTIRGVLTPLGRVLSHATRRGLIAQNPMLRLERGERPAIAHREMRTLDRNEIGMLLGAAAPPYRALLATSIFTGLRQGEVLGLIWADVDFGEGVVHVRKALDRSGARVEPKTANAMREVVLMPALARILRAHKLESRFAQSADYVFASQAGTPLCWRNVSKRGLEKAVARAGLDGESRPGLRFHDLRHTFASLLIAEGSNVVFVSRQLGHASPKMTLDTYAHLFDRAEHTKRVSAALEASFGSILQS